MTSHIDIMINLLRDSDRPASHAKLMDDAATALMQSVADNKGLAAQITADAISIEKHHKSINAAITELYELIDGGEECRGRDSAISRVIRILEGN